MGFGCGSRGTEGCPLTYRRQIGELSPHAVCGEVVPWFRFNGCPFPECSIEKRTGLSCLVLKGDLP